MCRPASASTGWMASGWASSSSALPSSAVPVGPLMCAERASTVSKVPKVDPDRVRGDRAGFGLGERQGARVPVR